jgi:hypothetical protein
MASGMSLNFSCTQLYHNVTNAFLKLNRPDGLCITDDIHMLVLDKLVIMIFHSL